MKILKTAIFALAAMGLAACSSMNTVENADKAGVKQMVNDKRVTTDSGLSDVAYVAGINETKTVSGLRKVQVELVNRTDAVRNVNYCFEWYDSTGMLINAPAPIWITIAIDAGESKFISSIGPTPDASDFRLKLLGNVRED